MVKNAEAPLLVTANQPDNANENQRAVELEDRRTPELIIGLVGPVGSGVSYTGDLVETILKDEFAYKPARYKVSTIIKKACELVGEKFDEALKGSARIESLQTLGNKLRQRFGTDYLSGKVIEEIALERVKNGGYREGAEGAASSPLPRRVVHIIDSLKNPAEVRHLRDVYGETFWLIGVFAPEDIRKERLREQKGIRDRDLQALLERDEDEGAADGQRVRDTIYEADFFLRNDGVNDERIKRSLHRFFDILFNVIVSTPTVDEAAMYTAVSSATSSACLSRQVGAAIYSANNELIGVGSNDVPKFGGGIYRVEDGDNDNRCFKYGGKICHNDERKEALYQHIVQQLVAEKVVAKNQDYLSMRSALAKTDIRNLIEYSRAVHAEMEAIISVARGNKPGLVGSTLYCTTFPCHSCARHIIAAGIRTVIYIEPYPKSLALHLHRDAISVDEKDEEKKVIFLQYDGIAPKNIVRFFKHGVPRKSDGKIITRSPKEALPVLQPLLDGYTTREQIVVQKLGRLEKANQQGAGDDGKI